MRTAQLNIVNWGKWRYLQSICENFTRSGKKIAVLSVYSLHSQLCPCHTAPQPEVVRPTLSACVWRTGTWCSTLQVSCKQQKNCHQRLLCQMEKEDCMHGCCCVSSDALRRMLESTPPASWYFHVQHWISGVRCRHETAILSGTESYEKCLGMLQELKLPLCEQTARKIFESSKEIVTSWFFNWNLQRASSCEMLPNLIAG